YHCVELISLQQKHACHLFTSLFTTEKFIYFSKHQ
ncbi:hypothetical protein ECFRIK1990_5791, partial [Escherichia coli FRIK1990]